MKRTETESPMSLGGKRVSDEFPDRFHRDRIEGRRRTLDEYLADDLGDPDHIARAYLALVDAEMAFSSDGRIDRGIGPYRIISEIGRGGQGSVHLAEDTRLGRMVALKILDSRARLTETAIERFRREARALAQLRHPSLCTVHEAGVVDETPFIAMERVDGRPLEQVMEKERDDRARGETPEYSTADKVRVIARCARALDSSHEVGVVHRDVKPANIILDEERRPVIVDFGLARIKDDTLMTGSLEFIGTPAYAAPEQFDGATDSSSRGVDIFSLGAVLFEWLTGHRPFDAPTIDAWARSFARGRAPTIREFVRNAPRDLAAIVAKAIEISPASRYRTSGAFADDLESFLDDRPVSARLPGLPRKAVGFAKRNPTAATLLSVVFLTLTAGIWLSSTALAESRENTRAAEKRSREIKTKLDEIAELSDRILVDDLEAEATRLWPISPEMIPSFVSWIERAEALAAKREVIRKRVDELERLLQKPTAEEKRRAHGRDIEALERLQRMRGRILSERPSGRGGVEPPRVALAEKAIDVEIASLEAAIAQPIRPKGGDARDLLRLDLLRQTVESIDRFTRDDGRIAQVRGRLATATRIRDLPKEETERAWTEAAARVAKDSRFFGKTLRPVVGFLPLGPDPETKLEEFLDLSTHTGEILERLPNGSIRFHETFGIVFVLLPGGTFTMGGEHRRSPDPSMIHSHQVTLAPFYMSKFEMTQAQWYAVTMSSPSRFDPKKAPPNFGVVRLNPVESVDYFTARTTLSNLGFELPTEAQWEYAARAGKSSTWTYGDDMRSAAKMMNHRGESDELTMQGTVDPEINDGWRIHSRVGYFPANAFGLCDVHGNVWEWCREALGTYDDPTLFDDGLRLTLRNDNDRVVRGGSFQCVIEDTTSAMRRTLDALHGAADVGLRPSRCLD